MASSTSNTMLQAAQIAQEVQKAKIKMLMDMKKTLEIELKEARDELKQRNVTVKRERELLREHKKRMKSASSSAAKSSKKPKAAIAAGGGKKKKKKKTPKNPKFKRPRGGAPKSDVNAGTRKEGDYENGGWKEPMVNMDMDLRFDSSDDEM